MIVLADELVLGVIGHLEPKSLKASRNVCRQWCRIATPLLFERVIVDSKESLRCFGEITQTQISTMIKIIFFESINGGELYEMSLLVLIANPTTLRLLPLPTSCDIHHYHTNCVTKLVGFNSNGDRAIAPSLEEIRIITPDIPYLGTLLFTNLREIHINSESVQLPGTFTFPVLQEFHITCNALGVDLLINFLHRHEKLQKLCLTIRIMLGHLTQSFLNFTKDVLRTRVSDELVDSIMKVADDAHGEARVFLKSVHREITKRFDEELVKELNQEFVTVFGLIKEENYENFGGTLERIRSAVENPNAAEIIFSVEYQGGELPRFEA